MFKTLIASSAKFILVFLLLVQSKALAICGMTEDPVWDFVGYARSIQDTTRLNIACEEMNPDMPLPMWGFSAAIVGGPGWYAIDTIGTGMAGSFYWMRNVGDDFEKTPRRKAFYQSLIALENISDPALRIKMVYELVLAYQPRYNDTLSFSFPSVVQLIDASGAGEEAGVCRDFANFLAWSLSKVSKNEYTAYLIAGYRMSHAWVRVKLPIPNFRTVVFDLDSTNHPDSFVALPPRGSKWSMEEVRELYNQCRQIADCLSQ